jgi:hypothetical protein
MHRKWHFPRHVKFLLAALGAVLSSAIDVPRGRAGSLRSPIAPPTILVTAEEVIE